MNLKQILILAVYIAIILVMMVTYFYVQPNFSYEQTHTSGEVLFTPHSTVAMQKDMY